MKAERVYCFPVLLVLPYVLSMLKRISHTLSNASCSVKSLYWKRVKVCLCRSRRIELIFSVVSYCCSCAAHNIRSKYTLLFNGAKQKEHPLACHKGSYVRSQGKG